MSTFDQARRDTLKRMGLGAIGLTLTDLAFNIKASYKARIGLQLYTVRSNIAKDFEGTIHAIADIGFLGIEYYPLPESITMERAAKTFRDTGLKVLGMHTPLPVDKDREAVVKLAEAFNCDRVVFPGGSQPEKFKNAEVMKKTAETYNEVAAFLRTKGLRFGLHNHSVEFEETGGIIPNYYFLEHLDKSIFFEIDTYWVKVAGKDPAKAVRDFGKRAPLLHIKDGPGIKGDTMDKQVPVGEGAMDFPAIVKAGGKNIDWMIVEFDEYEKDIFDGIRASYVFLTKKGLAEGKI